MNKEEILSEIKEALYPNLMKEQVLLLSPKLLNELFRDELEQNPGSPGQYYPFKPPVSLSSPLGGKKCDPSA